MTADEYTLTHRPFMNLNSGNYATDGIVQLTGDPALSVQISMTNSMSDQ